MISYLDTTDLLCINLEHVGDNKLLGRVHNLNSLKYLEEIVRDDGCFPNLYEKAAVYCFNIITRHVFIDGNKRTGMTAALWFLALNDVCITHLSDDEIIDTALLIANSKTTLDELVAILWGWEDKEKGKDIIKSLDHIITQYAVAWAKLSKL